MVNCNPSSLQTRANLPRSLRSLEQGKLNLDSLHLPQKRALNKLQRVMECCLIGSNLQFVTKPHKWMLLTSTMMPIVNLHVKRQKAVLVPNCKPSVQSFNVLAVEIFSKHLMLPFGPWIGELMRNIFPADFAFHINFSIKTTPFPYSIMQILHIYIFMRFYVANNLSRVVFS